MLISIVTQIKLTFFTLIAGIITGILFDIYRLIRGTKGPNKLLTAVEDILFWTLTSILVFIFLLYTNQAYVSIYIYLLIFIGNFIYLKFLSDLFVYVLYNFNKHTFKFFRIIFKNLIFPINNFFYFFKSKNKK